MQSGRSCRRSRLPSTTRSSRSPSTGAVRRRSPRSPPDSSQASRTSPLRPRPALLVDRMDLAHDPGRVVLEPPGGVVLLEASVVADPPDVVSDSVLVAVAPFEL